MDIATAIEMLTRPLDPARVSQRQGGGGRSLSYIEGYDAIDTANRIFGYGGWSCEVQAINFLPNGRYAATVQVSALNVVRTDVGFGDSGRDDADSHDKAIKAAVTDGMKRALRTFGEQFGNGLYDKDNPIHREAGQPQRPQAARPAPNNAAPAAAPRPASAGGGKITDKQLGYARKLAQENGHDLDGLATRMFGSRAADLSIGNASAFIDELKKPGAATVDRTADDVPF